MFRSAAAAAALLVISLAVHVEAADVASPSARTKSLADYEQFVNLWIAEKHVPSVTIGFFKNGDVWIRSFGYADIENHTPATGDSMYRFASVQKSMTAVAVLQLAEAGKLDLVADIRRYVPYFAAKAHVITPRLLLSHLSGLPHYVNRETEQHITAHKTTREAVAIFEKFDLLFEPGTRYQYSSYGYNLLGAAIENVANQPYAAYMREHVWLPANMPSTRMDDPLDLIPNRVRGYQFIDGELKNSEFVDVSSRFAAGGTRGTVKDLLNFMRALNDGKLLSSRMRELMYSQAITKTGEAVPYALGWQIPPFANRGAIVTNDGGQQETRTFILNDPKHNFGMALAMNVEADIYGPLVMKLYEAANGIPLTIKR